MPSYLCDLLPACQAELLKATMTTELIAQVSASIIGKPMAADVSSWRSSSFIALVVRREVASESLEDSYRATVAR